MVNEDIDPYLRCLLKTGLKNGKNATITSVKEEEAIAHELFQR